MSAAVTSALQSAYGNSSTTGTGSGSGGNNGSAASNVSADNFLTLFTTQLQYQDPTNPMESYELASQLAQFSTVSQLNDIKSELTTQSETLSSINNAQMINLIGQEVTGSGDSIGVSGGAASAAKFKLGADAAYVSIQINDADGNVVRTISLTDQTEGTHEIGWDGKDESGNTVADGNYSFTVEASDSLGNSIESSTIISGKVYSLQMNSGGTNLILDGEGGAVISVGSIMEVHEADSDATGESTAS